MFAVGLVTGFGFGMAVGLAIGRRSEWRGPPEKDIQTFLWIAAGAAAAVVALVIGLYLVSS